MALLAYEEPEKSPMFHLLSPEHRQNVAEGLNRAVLGMLYISCLALALGSFISNDLTGLPLRLMTAHANLPAYSSLERVVQQATVVRQYLQQEVGKVNIAK
jgi:glucose-induced degradation protein 8